MSEDKSVDQLAQLLQETKLPNGNGVSFAGQGLKLDTAADAQQVVDAIQSCSHLEYLNLEGNTIGVEAAEAISKALETHSEFKFAQWKDMFTSRDKQQIPKALKALCNGVMKAKAKLEILDLSDNASGPIGVDGIADFIKSPSCYTLKELRLNNMGLGVTGAQMLSSALLECCQKSEAAGNPLKLKVFIAGRNRLENEGTKALSKVFKKMQSLEELSIPQNGIYHVGISALSDALALNVNLKKLSLNDNSPCELGAKALAQGLKNVNDLRCLDLGDCLIKTSGACEIANLLKSCSNIQEVNLSFNSIKVEGALAVIEALSSKKNLSSLKLDGNKFGESGIEFIRKKVKELGKPTEILDSLEEDEGSEDDDEEEGEGEGEGEGDDDDDEDYDDEDESQSIYGDDDVEEISAEDEEEEESIKNLESSKVGERISGSLPTEFKVNSSVDIFISNPSVDNLMRLGKQPADQIVEEIKKKHDDINSVIEEIVSVTMIVSSLRDNAKTDSVNKYQLTEEYKTTLECTDCLYASLFSLALKSNCLSTVNNALPVCLGLIKSENKKSKVFSQESCLTALKDAMKRDYFPKETSDLMEFIMKNKPQKKIQKGN